MGTRLYLTIFACFLSLLLSGQNVREWTYNFQHFGLEDGLPSTEVYHVMQDRNLNLWFCTDRGVVKYDGHEFKSYNKSHGLPDLTIFKSFEDEKGRIWFSSFSHELSYFKNDSIYLFERNEELVTLWNKLSCKNLSPHDFFIRNDTIFVGIQKQQMLIVPPNSPVSEYRPNQLPKHINYIEVDTSGHSFGQYRWVPDHKGVIYFRGTYLRFDEKNHAPRRLNIKYIKDYNISLINTGILLFTLKNNVLKEVESFQKTIKKASLGTDLYIDKENGIWIGTMNNGVIYYKSIESLNSPPLTFLQGHTVSGILEDNQGGYWFTTTDAGIFHITDPGVKGVLGTNGKRVNTIADFKNHVYVGYQNGVVDKLKKGQVLMAWEKDLPGTPVYHLSNANDDHMLVSCYSINRSRGDRLENNNLDKRGGIKSISSDSQNRYHAATSNGIVRFCEGHDFKGNVEVYYDICSSIRANKILFDKNDTLWLGTRNGLYKSGFPHNETLVHNESIGDVRDIDIYSDKMVYVSKEGQIILEKNNQRFKLRNLNNNYLNTVAFENDSILWVGGNKGLIRLNTDNQDDFILFDKLKGLFDNDVKRLVKIKDTLWIGTVNGLNFIDLKQFSPPYFKPQIDIKSVKSHGQPVKGLNLSHKDNNIEILLNGLNLNNKHQIDFEYKIEGVSSSWNKLYFRRLKLEGLSPGDYTVKFRAHNRYSLINSVIKSFIFTITPPFWKTWWFITLIILFFISIVVFIFTLRIKELREKNLLQEEAFENEKKALIESQKALRAQMNPHFLFNSLNSIYHLIIKEDLAGAKRTLTKLSKLMRGLLEGSREELIYIEDEVTLLSDYLNLQKLQFEGELNFNINIDKQLEEDDYQIHSMLIQPFVENAIIHGLLPLKDRVPQLNIDFKMLSERKVRVEVKDNGIGRKASDSSKKDKKHKSLAMKLTQERLEHLSSFDKEYYFCFQDLDDGTLVELIIPLV